MRDAGIGRVLVAALHQGIADLLPLRLEFYETWFRPSGMRDGTIGPGPLTAALSFLRREGDAYALVTRRAGEYAGDWTVQALSGVRRGAIRALPSPVRARIALRIARALVRDTCAGSRAVVRVRRGIATIDIRSSIFCEVREPAPAPLCGFYAAAFERVLAGLEVPAASRAVCCRGTGQNGCSFSIALRQRMPPSDPDAEATHS